jgi:uncharacterized protein (DUF1015 family)
MQLKPLTALLPDTAKIENPATFFSTLREDYPVWRERGFFYLHPQPALFLLEMKNQWGTQRGIIANAGIDDYLAGRIKIHEKLVAAKEDGQVRLWAEQKVMSKPVLLAYQSHPSIEAWMDEKVATEPDFCFEFSEKDQQKLWVIQQPLEAQQLQQWFKDLVPAAYIADGHHRCSGAALAAQRGIGIEGIFAGFFPANDLKILAWRRTIQGLQGFQASDFLQKLATWADCETLVSPMEARQKGEICLLLAQQAYLFRWKPSVLADFGKQELDAQLLNELVLKNLLGIDVQQKDQRLAYLEPQVSLDSAQTRCNTGEIDLVFAPYPIDIADMMRLADAKTSLPPKSTWFEPRLKTGILAVPFPG